MIITQPLGITTPEGVATGRWRLVEMSDEHDGAEPLCECGGAASQNPTTCGHASAAEATECPIAAEKVRARRGERDAARPKPLLAYGSDGSGGVHMHLGDAYLHLAGDEARAGARVMRPGGIGPVDTTRRVPLRLVADINAADVQPGDVEVRGNVETTGGFVFACPGCGARSWLAIGPENPGPRWGIASGVAARPETVSLMPSILHAAPQGCGWHGYLTNGVFAPC